MALMAVENYADKQLLHKSKGTCCTSCCTFCIRCMSGFIVLLVIGGLILCVRFFLEFPVIHNGFRSTMNFSKESVDALMAVTPYLENPTNQTEASIETSTELSSRYSTEHSNEMSTDMCRMFVSSFKLLNESYLPQYGDTSTAEFQATAQRIQTLVNKTFFNSPLNSTYRKVSLFSLRSNPIIAYFQLLFCTNGDAGSEIESDAVVKILQSYNMSQQYGNISIDMNSVTVRACLDGFSRLALQRSILRLLVPQGFMLMPALIGSPREDYFSFAISNLSGAAPCPLFWNAAQPWPWQVIIKVDGTAVCTGSLLSAFWALSSANCLFNRNISLLSVILGSGNSSQTVAMIIQHPNFTAAPIYNNFALIRLSKPVWFTSSVTPLCLPQTTEEPAIGTVCNGSAGDLLSGVSVNVPSTVSSKETCLSQSQNGTICITPTPAIKQVSQVDTGNALVCINTQDNTSYIQGISPYSSTSSLISSTCLSYANIGPALDWFRSNIHFD